MRWGVIILLGRDHLTRGVVKERGRGGGVKPRERHERAELDPNLSLYGSN